MYVWKKSSTKLSINIWCCDNATYSCSQAIVRRCKPWNENNHLSQPVEVLFFIGSWWVAWCWWGKCNQCCRRICGRSPHWPCRWGGTDPKTNTRTGSCISPEWSSTEWRLCSLRPLHNTLRPPLSALPTTHPTHIIIMLQISILTMYAK